LKEQLVEPEVVDIIGNVQTAVQEGTEKELVKMLIK